MSTVPAVSVIMPVYNGEKYIQKAIESVLIQKVDFELIIIDDCSPLLHQHLGAPEGTVRLSFTIMTPREDIEAALAAVEETGRAAAP